MNFQITNAAVEKIEKELARQHVSPDEYYVRVFLSAG
ncbi:hypothetical protein EDD68_12723 [Melghiribacillus thermohalophilus]|uniref:Uncharacterized protein n=1 Tax=Melghiribacillus thermohalophilus TaxID=1324956 RepID=A0A4R3MPX4_9BACI|nr:hypothetical protein EDD68_12723 [Melghiribacillus thermohalophilus]